jgi:molecular chaperone GrpE
MSKRFKDDNGGEAPIILTPETAVAREAQSGPAPLSVEETIEVFREMDKLNERLHRQTEKIRELTVELGKREAELEELRAKLATAGSTASSDASSDAPADADPQDSAQDNAQDNAKDKEIAELKDKYLRALAEHENARRRIRQQSEDSVKRQKENLLRDLLPVIDNLERAIEAAKAKSDVKSIIEGVQMVLASTLDLLKANGVVPMKSVGEKFDPNKHEAADHLPHSSHPPNTVVSEHHRGYLIQDKVLRPARVVVSKGDGDGKGQKAE